MCKLGANTRKRSDGRYEVRINIGRNSDGVYRYIYGIDKRLSIAKKKLNRQIAKWQSGQIAAERHKALFSTITADWLQYHGKNRKSSTIAKYNDYCNSHILPYFGNMNISEITSQHLTDFYHKLIGDDDDCYCLSRNTTMIIMRVINLIKTFAQENGHKVNFMPTSIDIKARRADIQALDFSEQRRLERFIADNPSLMNLGIYLSLRTGIRIGELCGLRWSDISLVGKKMRIERTLQRICENGENDTKTKIVIDVPKSHSSKRVIPLIDCVCDRLMTFYRNDDTYILTGTDKPVEPRMMQYHFKKVLKNCGIEPVKFHILRHTFATNSMASGVDVKCLSAILGHSSAKVTLDIYVHPTLEMKRKSMAKIG